MREVFRQLDRILSGCDHSILKAILQESAYLIGLDREQAAILFLKYLPQISGAKDLEKMTWSLSYHINYNFEIFKNFFDQVYTLKETSEILIRGTMHILMSCWYFHYPGAKEQCWRFINRFADAKTVAVGIAFEHFYREGEILHQNTMVLSEAIQDHSKEVSSKFRISFLHIDHIKFEDIHWFLKAYVNSRSFVLNDYFISYLMKNSLHHPIECIELFELGLKSKGQLTDDQQYELGSNQNMTKFIVGVYNLLPLEELAYQKKMLRLFDKVLKDDRFRKGENHALISILE